MSVAIGGGEGSDMLGASSGMNEEEHGTVAGTTIYMSPEVMKSEAGCKQMHESYCCSL